MAEARYLRRWLLGGACMLLLAGTASAQSRDFDVAPGDLKLALDLYVRQSGVQLIYDADAIRGKRSPGVHGNLPPTEALKDLLAGTGLDVARDASGAVAIKAPARPKPASREPQGEEQGQTTQREEVIVTAQKRAENVMEVPSSISVLGGSMLEKTVPQSLIDLNGLVPGLTVTSAGNPGQAHVTLRGIADTTYTPLVGIYVDDVPIGATTGLAGGSFINPGDLYPFDLDRIEVLSGPQGTLYGASTMGGLLKYVFKDARLEDFEGRIGTVVDTIDGVGRPGGGFRAAINIPIIPDVLGIRLSGFDQRTPGYINNVGTGTHGYNAAEQDGGRLSALLEVNDELSLRFTTMAQNNVGPQAFLTIDPSTLRPQFGDRTVYSYVPLPFQQHTRLYTLGADWDVGFASVTSTSAWQTTTGRLGYDLTPPWRILIAEATDGAYPDATLPYSKHLSVGKFTQEVRLTSSGSQDFQWMVGAFYTHESTYERETVHAFAPDGSLVPGQNPYFDNNGNPSSYEEEAIFTNDTYHITDTFDITAGLRYSFNRQVIDDLTFGGIYGAQFLSPTNPASRYKTTLSEGVVTWLVSPEWHVDPDSMVYARIATGYRPGGATGLGPPAPPNYLADTLTSYEVGYKGTLLDKRLKVTLALYDIEWDKIQVIVVQNNLNYLGNGKTARSQGGEVGFSYRPTDALNLGLTMGYVDAQLSAPAPGISGLTGAALPYSTRFNGALTADYEQPLNADVTVLAGGAFRYASGYWTDVSSAPDAVKIESAEPVDIYAGLTFRNIEARLYVRNLFNSQVGVSALAQASYYSGFDTLRDIISPVQPRTIGLNIDVQF